MSLVDGELLNLSHSVSMTSSECTFSLKSNSKVRITVVLIMLSSNLIVVAADQRDRARLDDGVRVSISTLSAVVSELHV